MFDYGLTFVWVGFLAYLVCSEVYRWVASLRKTPPPVLRMTEYTSFIDHDSIFLIMQLERGIQLGRWPYQRIYWEHVEFTYWKDGETVPMPHLHYSLKHHDSGKIIWYGDPAP